MPPLAHHLCQKALTLLVPCFASSLHKHPLMFAFPLSCPCQRMHCIQLTMSISSHTEMLMTLSWPHLNIITLQCLLHFPVAFTLGSCGNGHAGHWQVLRSYKRQDCGIPRNRQKECHIEVILWFILTCSVYPKQTLTYHGYDRTTPFAICILQFYPHMT
jgi:hypothetical protein